MTTEGKSPQEETRRRYERAWLTPYTENIPVWNQLAYTARFLGREAKNFFVWRLKSDLTPEILTKLTVANFTLNLAGPSMLLNNGEHGVQITSAPQELFPGSNLFLWIPAFFDARYAPTRYDIPVHSGIRRRVTWRFCAKMASNPAMERYRAENQVFFTEEDDLIKLWPNFTF